MTRLNILIVDYTTHHPEVVTALGRMLGEHNVRFVLTASFVSKFGEGFAFRSEIAQVMPKKMHLRHWLAELAPLVAQQDLIIFSTALRDPLLLATLRLKTRARKIAFVHNTHYFTGHFPVDRQIYSAVFGDPLTSLPAWGRFLAQRWKFLKREFKHWRTGTRFPAIAKYLDYFCFGSEHLAAHFKKLTGLDNALVLPLSDAPQTALPRPLYEGVLRIGIIGLVSPDRRDYVGVIRALGAANFQTPVELHILGRCPDRAYGAQITASIAQIANPHLTVFFDPDSSFIPADELQRKLESIHLLLSPIRLSFAFHFYREEYGRSKISGAEADCIRYNRPILMPGAYCYSEYVAPFVTGYGDPADFARLVASLTIEANLDALNARAMVAAVEQVTQNAVARLLAQCARRD